MYISYVYGTHTFSYNIASVRFLLIFAHIYLLIGVCLFFSHVYYLLKIRIITISIEVEVVLWCFSV